MSWWLQVSSLMLCWVALTLACPGVLCLAMLFAMHLFWCALRLIERVMHRIQRCQLFSFANVLCGPSFCNDWYWTLISYMCFRKKLSFSNVVTHPKHIDHPYCLHVQYHNQYLNVSVWNTEKRDTKQNHHLVMNKFSCIAYNRTLIRRQSYCPHIFYWVAVTHVSAVFNPQSRNDSRWLSNFRRPSVCQSSAGVCWDCCLHLAVSLLQIFPVCKMLGRTIYASTSFLPRPAHPLLQSKPTSIWVHHILRLNASAQKNDMLMPLKHPNPLELHKASAPELSGTLLNTCTGTLQNLTGYLHRNPPEPHQAFASEPSKTSQSSCTETSGTAPGTCTWTF